jgi:hypothetical protein
MVTAPSRAGMAGIGLAASRTASFRHIGRSGEESLRAQANVRENPEGFSTYWETLRN